MTGPDIAPDPFPDGVSRSQNQKPRRVGWGSLEGVAEVRGGCPLRRTPPRKGTGGRGSFELRGWGLGGQGERPVFALTTH